MTALHRWLPVPLGLHEDERDPLWRCPCGASCTDPTPRLGEECAALAFPLDDP